MVVNLLDASPLLDIRVRPMSVGLTEAKVQQGLEMRGFWFQKKTVQLKTLLREVYTYVLNEIFFKKQCIFKAFVQNPRFMRLYLCTKGDFYCLFSSPSISKGGLNHNRRF